MWLVEVLVADKSATTGRLSCMQRATQNAPAAEQEGFFAAGVPVTGVSGDAVIIVQP